MAEKILMLALSPTMEEGNIVRWNRKEGDKVQSGELLCEVETDKATMELESPVSGTLLKILVPEGSGARVAEPIAIAGEQGEDISELLEEVKNEEVKGSAKEGETKGLEPEQPGAASPAGPSGGSAGRIKASPLARGMARQKGIDLGRIQGSGPGGRIVKRDVEAFVPAGGGTVSALTEEIVPLSSKRKIIAQRLSESKLQAPHYYLKLSIIMDGILEARKALNARGERKVSLNAFIMKLTAEALKRHPQVNSSWLGDSIKRFGTVDIGLAVAVPDGLMTPVVRSCETRGILDIDRELAGLIVKTREGRLLPEEYSGATFTITNLGSFGIEEFTAVINPPGSAIMAMGEIRRQVVLDEDAAAAAADWKDALELRSVMKVWLSCDHRVIDGAVGAAFLADLKKMMENPINALY